MFRILYGRDNIAVKCGLHFYKKENAMYFLNWDVPDALAVSTESSRG